MAKLQGSIRKIHGIFDDTTNELLGLTDTFSPYDGVDIPIAKVSLDSSNKVSGILNPDGTVASVGGVKSVLSSFSMAGDSRLAYGAQAAAGNPPLGWRSLSSIMWANDYLGIINGTGLDLTVSYAQGGETLYSSVFSGRWASFLVASTDIKAVMFGYNDLNPAGTAGQGRLTPDQFLANYEPMIASAVGTCKALLIFSSTPVEESVSSAYSNSWYAFRAVDAGLKQLAAKYGAIFIDQYTPILDTTSTQLSAIDGTIQTDSGDGVHFQTRGAQMIGLSVAMQIAEKLKITKYKTKGANLLPAFSGTGGTKTGTFTCTTNTNLPPDWDIYLATGGGAASSVVISQRANGGVRLVFDNTAVASDATFQLRLGATAGAALAAQIANGDLVDHSFGYQMFGAVDANLGGYLRFNNNSWVSFHGGWASTVEQTLVAPVVGVSGRRSGTPLTVGITPTACDFIIEVFLKASTGVCTLDVWNPEVCKLP